MLIMVTHVSFVKGGVSEEKNAVSPDIVANYVSIIYNDVNCSKLIDQILWSPLVLVRSQVSAPCGRTKYKNLDIISVSEKILRLHRREREYADEISMLINTPCIINSKCIDKNGELWGDDEDPENVNSIEGDFLIYPSTIAAYMFSLFNAFDQSDFRDILAEQGGSYPQSSSKGIESRSHISLLSDDSRGGASSVDTSMGNVSILSYEQEPCCRQKAECDIVSSVLDVYFKCAKKLFSGILTTLLKYENHARHRDTKERLNYLGLNINYRGLDCSIALSPRDISAFNYDGDRFWELEPFNIWQKRLKSTQWKSKKKSEIKSIIQDYYPDCADSDSTIMEIKSMDLQELTAMVMQLNSQSVLASREQSGWVRSSQEIQQSQQNCLLNIYLKNSSLYKTKVVTPECIAMMFGDTDLLDIICGKRPCDVIDTSSRGFKLSSLFACLSTGRETKKFNALDYWAVKNDWKHPFLTHLDDEYKKTKASFNKDTLTLKELFYVLCEYINRLETDNFILTKWARNEGIWPDLAIEEEQKFRREWGQIIQSGSQQSKEDHNILMLLKGDRLLETLLDRSCRSYIDDNFEYSYDRAHTFNAGNGWDCINAESNIYERCTAHECILRLRPDVEVIDLDEAKKVSPFAWLSAHRASPGRVTKRGGNPQPIINRGSRKKKSGRALPGTLHLDIPI